MKLRIWGKFLVVFTGIFLLKFSPGKSQSEKPRTPFLSRFQVSMGLGPTLLMGDLGGTPGNASRRPRDMNLPAIRGTLDVGARYKVSRWFSGKMYISSGWLSGSDRFSTHAANRDRQISVEAPFVMAGLQGEAYFLPDKSLPKRGFKADLLPEPVSPWSAFVLAGVGVVGTFPYFTSGLGYEPGARAAFALPVGLGGEYWWHPRWSLSLEGGYAFTFSDRIDGVSQRGNPRSPDGWFFLKAVFNLRFVDLKNNAGGVQCPNFVRGKAPSKKVQESKRMKFGKEYSKKKGNLNVKEYGR